MVMDDGMRQGDEEEEDGDCDDEEEEDDVLPSETLENNLVAEKTEAVVGFDRLDECVVVIAARWGKENRRGE
jgi:hypothetical protein